MGLAVAYQLVKDGHKPVIFEADDRVGGMTAAFDFEGLSIERYYHFHCTSDVAFLAMLKELGLSAKMHWVETKMGYWHLHRLQSWGNPLALLKFKGLSFAGKIRYGIHAFLCTKRNNWRPLDKLEATSWIRWWVGEDAYKVLWQKLFDHKFYDHANQLSAAWIWSRVRRIGRSRYNIFREKLGYLDGGSQTLLDSMSEFIEKNGGVIRLGSPVSNVRIKDGRVYAVEASGIEERFDKVISTIPLPYVSRVFKELPEEILNQYKDKKNIAVVCVILKLKKQVTENFWLNINDPEMDIPGLVEYTNLRPLQEHVVYVPYYMPGEHPKFQESDAAFIEKTKRYIMRINQTISDSDFVSAKASRYRFAQPICGPGYLDGLPPARLPIGGLWVADTSYYYPEDRGISESIHFGRNLAKDAVS